ncbi:MAG: PD40 domain-containing protein [Gammaproteobacteria bacterium]|nr:PD40 domain-containing protein [Gammaproteobacteria bacterium]
MSSQPKLRKHSIKSGTCIAAVLAAFLSIPDAEPGASSSLTLATSASENTEAIGPFNRLTDPGGCVIEQVTTGDHDEYQVQGASVDGKFLVIAANLGGAAEEDSVYEVHEVELATGERTDLSHALTNSGPYSPDNRFIVLAQASDSDKTDIFEYERASSELHPVATHEDWDWLPSYSPDGRFIVFNSYRVGGQSDIHLYEKSTGTLTRLTDFPGYDAHAQFSPDGKQLLFHRQQGTRDEGGYVFNLFVHDLETGEERQLTDGSYEKSYPAWAPDGRHIVYSSDIDGKPEKHNLYILGPDGETLSRLTQGDWKDSYAYWTRDGNYIYFNSDRSGATNVYRMPMHGAKCVMKKGHR